MNLLMLGKISRLGTRNVRTLYQTDRLKEVAREFNAYKLDILGTQKQDGQVPEDNPPNIEPAEVVIEIDLEPPSTGKILGPKKKQLRNNEAAGPDGIPGDAIKGSAESSAKALTGLFQRIWTTEVFPQEWKEGHIVKLPKKGNLQECGNHRGITLLSVPGKVFNRVILEKLKVVLDEKLREEQGGFRKGPQSQREAKNDVEERNRGRDGICTEDMERTGGDSTR
ncbi:LINE-1 retrotransposable element ORF2 protein [Elysia marginata]|uniref:LINE-1 retrotransposable element ORF2 protein n=1 Tax=Elysia marginata TaxID=1093978 RepID=A0AAV4EM61_9GAST|nr:LINE-1 retrotransposable element ORF2 protein [Elysia marginata]